MIRGIEGLRWAILSIVSAALLHGDFTPVRTFGVEWGLFDVSSDGLVLLEKRTREKFECKLTPCGRYFHLVEVRSADSGAVIHRLKIGFEGFGKVALAFVPGSKEVLVRGTLARSGATGFHLWLPSQRTSRVLPAPPPAFEFVAAVGGARVLGSVRGEYFLWDWSTGALEPATADDPVIRPYLPFGRELKSWLAANAPGLRLEEMQGGALSRDGRYAAVLCRDGRDRKLVLTGYDLEEQRPLFAIPFGRNESARTDFVGRQVAVSRAGDAMAVSYSRYGEARGYKQVNQQACFAVHRLGTGEFLGLACNPARRMSAGPAYVNPAASGELLFSADGKFLYTTSRGTVQWSMPASPGK